MSNYPFSVHQLKILPQFFDDILNRKKTFELRRNDRDFKLNDILVLHELECIRELNQEYTGRSLVVKVTYILPGKDLFGLDEEFFALGFEFITYYNI